MNDDDERRQEYYDRKVRKHEETLVLFIKLCLFVAATAAVYELIV